MLIFLKKTTESSRKGGLEEECQKIYCLSSGKEPKAGRFVGKEIKYFGMLREEDPSDRL